MTSGASAGKGVCSRSIGSLVGGFVVAAGVFVESLLLYGDVTTGGVLVTLVLAALVGGYVRLADL